MLISSPSSITNHRSVAGGGTCRSFGLNVLLDRLFGGGAIGAGIATAAKAGKVLIKLVPV